MKVLFINGVCGFTSTGRIACELADALTTEGHECKIAYGRSEFIPDKWKHYGVRIGSKMSVKMDALKTRMFDNAGFGSKKATLCFLEWANEFNPDVLWLHNLHGYYINIELLFAWIKERPEMKVKWTLHDCWSFTGHCAHFSYEKCEKWKTCCEYCEKKHAYPASYFIDNSKCNYENKKRIFSGVKNMTLITPSNWLAGLVKQSFLKEYPVEVRYNEIDRNIFKPTVGDFRSKYNIVDKFIVLGVANDWDEKKGYNDFIEISGTLPSNCQIVMVGVSKKQIKSMPSNIIGIQKTNDAKELAEIYTAADVFVNPTYEDNYPTVDLEAEACGTKVICYDAGGTPETIKRKDSIIVKTGDVDRIIKEIKRMSCRK